MHQDLISSLEIGCSPCQTGRIPCDPAVGSLHDADRADITAIAVTIGGIVAIVDAKDADENTLGLMMSGSWTKPAAGTAAEAVR